MVHAGGLQQGPDAGLPTAERHADCWQCSDLSMMHTDGLLFARLPAPLQQPTRDGASQVALDQLGFSPCFHARFMPYISDLFDAIYEYAEGRAEFPARELFRQFNAAVDIPAPLIPLVLEAYPDAKVGSGWISHKAFMGIPCMGSKEVARQCMDACVKARIDWGPMFAPARLGSSAVDRVTARPDAEGVDAAGHPDDQGRPGEVVHQLCELAALAVPHMVVQALQLGAAHGLEAARAFPWLYRARLLCTRVACMFL